MLYINANLIILITHTHTSSLRLRVCYLLLLLCITSTLIAGDHATFLKRVVVPVKKSFKERHKLLQLELQSKVLSKVDSSQVGNERIDNNSFKDSENKNNLSLSKNDTRVESKKEEGQAKAAAAASLTASQRQAAISISAEGLQLLNNLHKQVPYVCTSVHLYGCAYFPDATLLQ